MNARESGAPRPERSAGDVRAGWTEADARDGKQEKAAARGERALPAEPGVPALRIRDLRKRYGGTEALRGVSFDIRPGEFFGLLGPNGAGKTTLINIVTGLVRRTSGVVEVFGRDVTREYMATRRWVGAVPQELVYDHFFTVRRALEIHAGYFGVRRPGPWIEELLDRLELRAHQDKTVLQLSGGLKRRLLVAKALVHRPPFLILDEPTAGVDINLRLSLWDLIREENARGATVLLTTHYIEEAEELCQRIGIIDHGQFVALDRTENLVRQLNEKKVTLVTQRPVAALPEALAGLNAALEDGGKRIVLRLDRDPRTLNDALQRVAMAGVALDDFRVEDADLEEVFIRLTRARRAAPAGGSAGVDAAPNAATGAGATGDAARAEAGGARSAVPPAASAGGGAALAAPSTNEPVEGNKPC